MSDLNLDLHRLSLEPKPVTAGHRSFVVTGLTAGFALAVQPVSAQTITTDADGLEAGEVKIPAQGGEMPAYRAMPARGSDFPVVLAVHKIFGVHEYIKDVCRRFAKLGYLAVAPDLYARQGRVDNLKDFADIRKVVGQVPDAQVMSDLDAALAWAAEDHGNASKVAVTGFCWGGRITWLYAELQPKLRAAVAWYGSLVSRQPTALQPKSPIELVDNLHCPVLGLYGEADAGIPVASIEQMKEALKAAVKTNCEFVVYPRGNHGFHADYRPSYQKEYAEDGWNRLLAWFKSNGVA
jgi:carboxymethylenebutenolidase